MRPLPITNSPYDVGALCVGGDWACAHGDFGALRAVALRLHGYLPTHHELIACADACHANPDRAALLWDRFKRARS
jgi:hypothetical protein